MPVKLKLTKKPKNPIVLEGFPGFGLVATIATEFLVDHLECEKIGRFYFDDMPATVAIHKSEIIDPVSIYYNKKNNLVIIHSVSGTTGVEWLAADTILKICKDIGAKELISIEGVGSSKMEGERVFYFTNKKPREKDFKKLKIETLGEGIIMGVTSALILKSEMPLTCIFAETHSELPDSKAAANVIKVLDNLLRLNVDFKPLLKQAEKFEEKLKALLEQGAKMQDENKKKKLTYVG